MESVIARVLKDPKQSIKGMRLLRFARNVAMTGVWSLTWSGLRPGGGCKPPV